MADQDQRAAPLLSRLVALAPTPTSRVVAEATLAEAQRREATGHYLLDGYADQIGALQRAFSGRTSQETAWLLALLAQLPQGHRRADDAICLRPFESEDRTHDVDDRIERAHFVKVHAVDRRLVNRRFGLPETLKHRLRTVATCGRQTRSVDQREDLRKASVGVRVPRAGCLVLGAVLGARCGVLCLVLVLVFLLTRGPGPLSLDHLIERRLAS